MELQLFHGHISVHVSDFRARTDISCTDRPCLGSPDPADHCSLELHARARSGHIPARWGLEQHLSSPEKGFSVGAELAVLKLALRSARRPSEIIWVSACQAEAVLGCRDLLLTEERKEVIFLTLLCRPLLCKGTPLLLQSVQYLIHHACVLPAVWACLLPGTGAKSECGIFPAGPRVCCCQGSCGRVEE